MTTSGANIQVEDGEFLRIHNAILELLAKAPLRGQQFRCLMFLFRKTYGFNKKEDKISLAQWAEGTGLLRQNVWRELQLLIKCNVIYMASSGPKRPNTWGFNKRHEQWNFESVISEDYKTVIVDDYTSVIASDYNDEPSVITSDDKSVITPHEHTKDNKDKQSSLLAATDSDNAMAIVREAYQAVSKIGPPMRDQVGKANLIVACDLIERYGFDACIRGISTLRERSNSMAKKQRHGISAPLPYLRTIMEGELGTLVSAPVTLDFTIEDTL